MFVSSLVVVGVLVEKWKRWLVAYRLKKKKTCLLCLCGAVLGAQSVTVEHCSLGTNCMLVRAVSTELRVLVVAMPLVELLGLLVATYFSRVFFCIFRPFLWCFSNSHKRSARSSDFFTKVNSSSLLVVFWHALSCNQMLPHEIHCFHVVS